jgi:hypothetical protein
LNSLLSLKQLPLHLLPGREIYLFSLVCRFGSPSSLGRICESEPHQRDNLMDVRNRPMIHEDSQQGGSPVAASQVVLYFDEPKDALLFTLAASSVMSGDGQVQNRNAMLQVAEEIGKASRITAEGVLNT